MDGLDWWNEATRSGWRAERSAAAATVRVAGGSFANTKPSARKREREPIDNNALIFDTGVVLNTLDRRVQQAEGKRNITI